MANKAILVSASTVALLAFGSPLHAQATLPSQPQATPQSDIVAAPTSDIQDIVVTATRQATNQQATPLAITAVTAAQLEERGLKSTADLSAVVPNATFRRAQGAFGPGVTAFIRGIGQADTSLGSEPAVAYYVDDVYYPLLLGSNFDLLDLDHIEVLRGPQGTLFGRNALAGAINIVSKQPSLTDASGYGQVTVGSYNRTDVRAGFNVPLTDKLAIQVGALSKKRTGYQQVLDFRCQMNLQGTPALAGTLPFASAQNTPASNFTPSSCVIGHQGGEDVRAVKGTLLFKPTDNVKLTISGDYTRDQSENPADSLISVTNPGAANVQAQAKYFGVNYDSRFVTGNPYTTYVTYTDPVGAGVVVPGDNFHNGLPDRGGASFSPLTDLQNWGVSGRLVVGLTDKIDLTTIVGYRDLNEHHSFDLDASPLVVEHTQLNVGEHYTNVEARLSGKSSLIDWVAGAFYFEGKGFTHAIIYSPQANFYKIQNIAYKPISKAVFANVTIKPLNRLDITLGGRYSDDKKAVNFTNVLDTNFGTTNTVGDTRFNVTPNAKRFDWKAGADYHVADNIMVYASASTGARLPGYNTRPMQPSQVVSYAGDQTLAYELGAKADLFDRRLRLNGNLFYTDYKTRITSVSGQEANLLTGGPIAGPSTVIPLPAAGASGTTCRAYSAATDGAVNLAKGVGVTCIARSFFVNTPGKVKGFELEADLNPVPGLLINGSVGYSNFSSPDLEIATRANNKLAGVPEINANAGIQYMIPADKLGGTITPRFDWAYTGAIAESALRNTFNQPAYSVFNARLTYYNEKHDFTAAVGATNLFSKLYYQNFFVYQDIGYPGNNAQPAAPRQWFVELGKKF